MLTSYRNAMELRHLRYFIAVAEHLSFTRAAEALETAQPSLSQQIRALESELEVPLFERNRRHVALTEEGRLLLPDARAIVQLTDSLSTLRDRSAAPRGPLRIASITASTIGVLPRVLGSYRRKYPGVAVSVETWGVKEAARALLERRVDVAFTRGPAQDSRIDTVVAASEDLCIALPLGHPLASRKRIAIRDVTGLETIEFREEQAGGLNEEVAIFYGAHDVKPASVTETSGVETMMGLVASGMGVAVISAVIRLMRFHGVVLRPLQPRRTSRTLRLAWRTDRARLPVIRSFRDHLVEMGLTFSIK